MHAEKLLPSTQFGGSASPWRDSDPDALPTQAGRIKKPKNDRDDDDDDDAKKGKDADEFEDEVEKVKKKGKYADEIEKIKKKQKGEDGDEDEDEDDDGGLDPEAALEAAILSGDATPTAVQSRSPTPEAEHEEAPHPPAPAVSAWDGPDTERVGTPAPRSGAPAEAAAADAGPPDETTGRIDAAEPGPSSALVIGAFFLGGVAVAVAWWILRRLG